MAKETLRQYLNRRIKDKGTSLTAEKKKAGKYKSISAAKKAGSLYYTDKNGKVMAAVFANDLKEKTKDTAVKTSKRPKIRRRGFSVPSVTVTLLPDKYMDEKPRSSDRGKANRTISRKRKPGGPDPSAGKLSKLKGINWMKAHTYADYMALSKSEARALGLPATRLASTQHKLRNQKFKDGKNFMGK